MPGPLALQVPGSWDSQSNGSRVGFDSQSQGSRHPQLCKSKTGPGPIALQVPGSRDSQSQGSWHPWLCKSPTYFFWMLSFFLKSHGSASPRIPGLAETWVFIEKTLGSSPRIPGLAETCARTRRDTRPDSQRHAPGLAETRARTRRDTNHIRSQ